MVASRLFIVNSVLAVVVAGTYWGRRIEGATVARPDFLQQLQLSYRGWPATDIPLSEREKELLQPDAVLVRRFKAPDGSFAELAVISGHRKRSVHTPGFCMTAGGWELLSQRAYEVRLGERSLPATQSVFSQDNKHLLATYFFTDGEFTTRNLVQFQLVQMLRRFQPGVPLGALVRIIIPVTGDPARAEQLTTEFASALLPSVLDGLKQAKLQVR